MKTNTIIESLGVYLPSQSFSTIEVLQGCKAQIRFPLEKVTGIESRRMAGTKEFSIDLARKAIADCLEKSKYSPSDIDLLICCNISRFDGPELLSYEPSTSIKLRKYFGFDHAMVFDITNACAGMFTGIYLVNALLETGAIRRGMVVSGEYITHLTQTAQKEIESFMDTRLACLTLGDAGAAVILEKGPNKQTGFHEIDLQTFGRYSPYCIAKESETGRWIMYTDSVNLTDIAIKSGAKYALDSLQRVGWPPDSFQYLIMHQTSRMTLNSARREINNLLKSNVIHDGNMINNLEERGNTASTSHFIAIADQILNNKIQSGDKLVFSISASGLTVGTALYVFDDLPDRLREPGSKVNMAHEPVDLNSDNLTITPRVRIESLGTISEGIMEKRDSMELLHRAAKNCLQKSSYQCHDIGLLIYCGVYRSDYVMEPAYASLLAGKLDMNASFADPENKKTLAFDIFNGSMGCLNACYVAQQLIGAGNCKTAMIVAAEIENNTELFPDELLGLRETASAIILDAQSINNIGFSRIGFNYQDELLDAYTVNCSTMNTQPCLMIKKDLDLDQKYIACIASLIEESLHREGLDLTQIDMVFPPQISSGFINQLSKKLNLPKEKFVDVVGDGPDFFSSSLAYALEYAYEKELIKSGDTGLVIAVGSGIQVGCSLYHF